MPFQSEKQRRYLWANEPKIARDWADTYGSRIKKDDGGIMNPRLVPHTGADLLVRNTATGERPKYQPPGGGETSLGSGAAHSNRESDRQPGMNVHTQAQKKQQRKDVQNLQAQMKGQGSGSDASDYVKMQQHLEDPIRHAPPEIKKTLGDKHRDWRAEQEKKSYKKLMLHKMKGSPFTFPSMFANLKGAMSDEDFEKAYGMSYEDFKTMNPMQMEAIFGSVKGAKHATGYETLSQADRDDIRRLSGGIKEGGDWEEIFYGPKGPPQPGGGGYMGYPSYAAWLAAQRGTGDITEVAEVIEEPISDFQKSLTGTVDTPGYYVGNDPTASNLAWGKQFGADPRTMGRTSWAANGGRIPAAFGGIMDSSTGRRAYGFGSIFKSIKKAAKKVFKSPIAKGALMAGLGAYGMGWGPFGAKGMFSGAKGAGFLGNMMSGKLKNRLFMKNLGSWAEPDYTGKGAGLSWGKLGLLGAGALPFLMGDQEEDEGSKFDYMGAKNAYADEIKRIKAGAMAGSLDPNEFSYLGVKDGGRIGLYAGGQSIPSDYTMEDAMMTTTQDKLGGITDVMKQADLFRKGSVGQFYAAHGGSADAKLMARIKELQDEGLDYNSARAQAEKEAQGKAHGGRIGYGGGTDLRNKMSKLLIKLANGTITDEEIIELRNIESASGFSTAQGKAEGGLMDLGGMEKDYRNDGGFVPLGGEEKADDVPARLSKNEFVFTADAVRGAGDGDIDKGAEIMENIMKNLEQGGQISEETQGLSGAQEMFGVSERLSEVV